MPGFTALVCRLVVSAFPFSGLLWTLHNICCHSSPTYPSSVSQINICHTSFGALTNLSAIYTADTERQGSVICLTQVTHSVNQRLHFKKKDDNGTMANLPLSFPLELQYRIFRGADRRTITNIARASKLFSLVACEILYKDLESPWPLIQLVLEHTKRAAASAETYKAPNPAGGFTIESPIHSDDIARFRDVAALVRNISYIENERQMCAKSCAIASEHIYNLIKDTHNINHQKSLLMRLRSLHASCMTSYGVRGLIPWLSHSLETLDLAFGPEINDTSVIFALLHVGGLCKAVKSFTFTLDSSEYSHRRLGGSVIDTLCAAILGMTELRMVSLPSELIMRPIADALGQLKHLNTLFCTPTLLPVVGDTAVTPPITPPNFSTTFGDSNLSPLDLGDLQSLPSASGTFEPTPSIVTSQFFALHNMRTSFKSQREVALILRDMDHSPVVTLSLQLSPHERAAALLDNLADCPVVEIHFGDV